MAELHSDVREEYYGEEPIRVSHIWRVLQSYSGVITIVMAGVIVLYLVIALGVYLFGPQQKVVSEPFRLEFSGGATGQYPNGFKFSVADISATPVLLDVYNANDLSRFVTFDKFSKAIYVLESNRALEQLTAEYEAKLADPKLTPVDRDRLEHEFESKRAGVNKSEYAIQFLVTPDTKDIPTATVRKVLSDMLSTWARRAAVEKKALDYQVAVLSPSLLNGIAISDNDYLIPLLLLRQRVDDVITNAKAVASIPGVQLIRTRGDKLSINEVQLRLDEIVRFRLEPLIATARAAGLFGSNSAALEILKAQLAYDQRLLNSAQMKETALRNALLTYQAQEPGTQQFQTGAASPATAPTDRGTGETVMPQLSDTFLDRVVDLANRNADRDYRQKLTDEIKQASLAVVPADAAVKYDQELIDSFKTSASGGSPAAAALLKTQWDAAIAEVRESIVDLNQIYSLASKQLYPETEMYRVTGPPVARVEHSLSPSRFALYGLLVFLVTLPITLVVVLLHNRVREEQAAEEGAATVRARQVGRNEPATV